MNTQTNRKYLFLTGATGFIGKNFLKKAKKKGHKILALSRRKQSNRSKQIFWIKGELDDNFDKYLKQTHTLIHFASAGVNKKRISLKEALDENVNKPRKLLLNCLKNGCKKWVIIGSASEYGKSAQKKNELKINTKPRPVSNYEKSKYKFSKTALFLSKKNKVKCRVMRIFNVYGKGENKKKLLSSLNHTIKKKVYFTVNSSNQKKDFIEIEKVTSILIDAINFKKKSKKFPQIWHIASGNPLTVREFVNKKISKYKNVKIKFKNTNKTIRNFVSNKKSIWKI
tara:strand:- start:1217 stop:2065 length:849 start_codon:yes stop_codon:yes gene_type:complete